MTQLTESGVRVECGQGVGGKTAGAETTEEAKLMHNVAAGETLGKCRPSSKNKDVRQIIMWKRGESELGRGRGRERETNNAAHKQAEGRIDSQRTLAGSKRIAIGT